MRLNADRELTVQRAAERIAALAGSTSGYGLRSSVQARVILADRDRQDVPVRLSLTSADLQRLAQTPADQAALTCFRLNRWGWSLGPREPGRRRAGLVAIDAEALHERLAAGDSFDDILTAADHWRLRGAIGGQHLQVITSPHHTWTEALVVDLFEARRIPTAGGRRLLVTRCGRYVHIDSAIELSELSELEAARLVYQQQYLPEEDLPPVLLAARHARRMVAALALPAEARTVHALAGVRAAATVTELLRSTVGADVRAQRGIVAQVLVERHGSQAAARVELGIAKSTLSELLSVR
ncbi:hypothetical protein [Streptomyces sp. CBMA156]|uniref:hypothetical protein n=1 Tax=Streptomyces sp. CBMA156 TaxID=1930280 RepID=UPI001661D235|nr:hypothetical protein [Streptomyces sp. CBMA156]MBD0675652.1 hypothetical protein [Streptomyces sp. CBMA156]